jgi:hypothetical protein
VSMIGFGGLWRKQQQDATRGGEDNRLP